MSNKIILSIVILKLSFITSIFLQKETNYRKQLTDINNSENRQRNNIINKGVWVKKAQKDSSEKTSSGNFIFRTNSLDVENQLQGGFNAFEDDDQNELLISSYIERNKRSLNPTKEKHRKDIRSCNTKNCISEIENKSFIKSKLINKLKPASVFNDYPYEIAVLLSNNRTDKVNYTELDLDDIFDVEAENKTDGTPLNERKINDTHVSFVSLVDLEDLKDIFNNTRNNISFSIPKRSMREEETKIIKKLKFSEEINKTSGFTNTIKVDRDVFDKVNTDWHQNAPIPNTNRYKVVPKINETKNKFRPMSERGLIKILSMLTKTFKKIMRQHDDIKEIHKKLYTMNEDFLNNIATMADKFKDFDTKFEFLMKFNEKLKDLEDKFDLKEQNLKNKEDKLSDKLIEFENQQKKFLTQQRQFYNIQKLMLAQNEKINNKQNMIAKTQSEISHRQNNFARILKKAKQIYIDSKQTASVKMTPTYALPKDESSYNKTDETEHVTYTTMVTPQSTDSIKINLFSIPSISRLENQDHLLLKEKDYQPIDDLVYKYYFNNTFIDNFIKNKFLSSFVSTSENNQDTRNAKNKRQEKSKLETTLLLPIKTTKEDMPQIIGGSLNRERRWISHHSRRRNRRKHRGKSISDTINDSDEKYINNKRHENLLEDPPMKTEIIEDRAKIENSKLNSTEDNRLNQNDKLHSEPFMKMAKSFCNGIGQNFNRQVLDWCVEKALRRLQNIEKKIPTLQRLKSENFEDNLRYNEKKETTIISSNTLYSSIKLGKTNSIETTASTAPSVQSTSTTPGLVTITPTAFTSASSMWTDDLTQNTNMFFPDNDELESNLKQYELKPDTEGNIYFDGSLHASDIISNIQNQSEDISDVMPGFDSNSRIDSIDPSTFDPQAIRRAFVRRMKFENMLKKMPRRLL